MELETLPQDRAIPRHVLGAVRTVVLLCGRTDSVWVDYDPSHKELWVKPGVAAGRKLRSETGEKLPSACRCYTRGAAWRVFPAASKDIFLIGL